MHRLIFSVVLLLVASKALYLFWVSILTYIPEIVCLRKNLSCLWFWFLYVYLFLFVYFV